MALLQKFLCYPERALAIFSETLVSDFKWRHFQGEIILWAIRWYCRYGVSYRDLEQNDGRARCAGRSFHRLSVGPEMRARDREAAALALAPAAVNKLACRRNLCEGSWAMALPLPCVDKFGNTIDFYLSPTRKCQSGQAFSGQGLERPEGLGKANYNQHRQGSMCGCPGSCKRFSNISGM